MVISSDLAGDTDAEGIACHELSALFTRKPKFLQSEKVSNDSGSLNKINDPTKLSFYIKERVIDKVEIFSYKETEGEDSVNYDKAIVFHGKGVLIIVSSVWTIDGGITISNSETDYKTLMDECQLND